MPHRLSAADDERHLAAEYALGTLDGLEREAARARLAEDADFAAQVRLWDMRLAPLHELVVPIAPPPGLWRQIAASLPAPEPAVPEGAADAAPAAPGDASGAASGQTDQAATDQGAGDQGTADQRVSARLASASLSAGPGVSGAPGEAQTQAGEGVASEAAAGEAAANAALAGEAAPARRRSFFRLPFRRRTEGQGRAGKSEPQAGAPPVLGADATASPAAPAAGSSAGSAAGPVAAPGEPRPAVAANGPPLWAPVPPVMRPAPRLPSAAPARGPAMPRASAPLVATPEDRLVPPRPSRPADAPAAALPTLTPLRLLWPLDETDGSAPDEDVPAPPAAAPRAGDASPASAPAESGGTAEALVPAPAALGPRAGARPSDPAAPVMKTDAPAPSGLGTRGAVADPLLAPAPGPLGAPASEGASAAATGAPSRPQEQPAPVLQSGEAGAIAPPKPAPAPASGAEDARVTGAVDTAPVPGESTPGEPAERAGPPTPLSEEAREAPVATSANADGTLTRAAAIPDRSGDPSTAAPARNARPQDWATRAEAAVAHAILPEPLNEDRGRSAPSEAPNAAEPAPAGPGAVSAAAPPPAASSGAQSWAGEGNSRPAVAASPMAGSSTGAPASPVPPASKSAEAKSTDAVSADNASATPSPSTPQPDASVPAPPTPLEAAAALAGPLPEEAFHDLPVPASAAAPVPASGRLAPAALPSDRPARRLETGASARDIASAPEAALTPAVPEGRGRGPWVVASVVLALVASLLGAYAAYRELYWGRPPGLVALLQSEPAPAVAVRVDAGTGVLYVRALAPAPQAGHVYQLWLTGPSGDVVSLGTFTTGLAARSDALRAAKRAGLSRAVLSVTLEPGKGSPRPTGAVLFSGRLVPE